jgi:hypothetical protein
MDSIKFVLEFDGHKSQVVLLATVALYVPIAQEMHVLLPTPL